LPGDIVRGMSRLADQDGLKSIADLRDSRLDHWAAKSL
jgi:dihydroorotate dehydrogenase